MAHEIPKTFRSANVLRTVTDVAVAASLAGAAGFAIAAVFGDPIGSAGVSFDGRVAVSSALSTFVFGTLWMKALRSRKTLGKSGLRCGWVASIPLAILNAATACGFLFALERNSVAGFFGGALLGATFGAVCWIPALVLTLAAFGVPIAWAQRQADKGLAGEERGELVVGTFATMIGAATVAFLPQIGASAWANDSHAFVRTLMGLVTLTTLACFGGTMGLLSILLAYRRQRHRRAFVGRVEAGEVPGYRIDASDEGKVLLRVSSVGHVYRVADFEEPLLQLDASNDAQFWLPARR